MEEASLSLHHTTPKDGLAPMHRFWKALSG